MRAAEGLIIIIFNNNLNVVIGSVTKKEKKERRKAVSYVGFLCLGIVGFKERHGLRCMYITRSGQPAFFYLAHFPGPLHPYHMCV